MGALCRACASLVAPCEGLIPDHIHSRTDTTDAEAWVIDGFGNAHAIGASSRIGRSHDCDLVVLASSVSREHAELSRAAAGWTVRDLGSRNGTFVADPALPFGSAASPGRTGLVDGERLQAPAVLPARARVKLGDVALWLISELAYEPPQAPTMTTDGSRDKLVRYELVSGDTELCIVVTGDAAAAGTLLWRRTGGDAWSERGLAPLEFQLLRVLCQRAHEEASSPSTIRGCVPSKQLVSALPFQSKYANQENVRQIVLRLRGVLTEVGVAGLLAIAPGRGYYLACSVRVAGTEPVRITSPARG